MFALRSLRERASSAAILHRQATGASARLRKYAITFALSEATSEIHLGTSQTGFWQ